MLPGPQNLNPTYVLWPFALTHPPYDTHCAALFGPLTLSLFLSLRTTLYKGQPEFRPQPTTQPISVMRLRIILLHMQRSPAYGYNWEDVSSGKTEHLVQSFVIHRCCIACNVNFSLLHKQLPVSILRLCIVLHCTLGSIVFLFNLPILYDNEVKWTIGNTLFLSQDIYSFLKNVLWSDVIKSTRSSCCNENCDNFSEDFSMFVAMLEIRSPSSPELVDIELEKKMIIC